MTSLRLIVNARIVTGDPRRPWTDAVVLDGSQVVLMGASAELRKRFGTHALVIDAKGAVVDPTAPSSLQSLLDAHGPAD